MPVEQLFGVDQACLQLGIRRSKLYQLIKEGKLSVRKIGARTLMPGSSIAAYIDTLPSTVTKVTRRAA
jgi:excisionase family DNA binding protein